MSKINSYIKGPGKTVLMQVNLSKKTLKLLDSYIKTQIFTVEDLKYQEEGYKYKYKIDYAPLKEVLQAATLKKLLEDLVESKENINE